MKKTILAVDDDMLFIELVREVLTLQDHNVVSANNGNEALLLLEAQHIDAIISDIEMPAMNGIALHSTLSRDERWKHIPFVFLSGTEDPKLLHYIRERPSLQLIKKSTPVQKLVNTVSENTQAHR